MKRIDQVRHQASLEHRSRWWRDGLVCGLVGAAAGAIGSVTFGMDAFMLVPIAGGAGAVLGAVFGDRVLPLFNW